jgi:hypothetical protein
MIFILPFALLGLSGLSLGAPTEVKRSVEPTDWVSEHLHETSLSSIKMRRCLQLLTRNFYAEDRLDHVPIFQCNSYHSPVEARASKYTIWKFCNGMLDSPIDQCFF